jgi:hypothetical protein
VKLEMSLTFRTNQGLRNGGVDLSRQQSGRVLERTMRAIVDGALGALVDSCVGNRVPHRSYLSSLDAPLALTSVGCRRAFKEAKRVAIWAVVSVGKSTTWIELGHLVVG